MKDSNDIPPYQNVTKSERQSDPKIKSEMRTTATGKSLQLLIRENDSSLNDLIIIPIDFENSKDTFRINDADPLLNTWLLDLDNNGYDELYLVTSSVGSGSYATIYGYASNQDLSLTPIYVPTISENDVMEGGDFIGYMGHDSIYVEKNRIYRKYPIYKKDDPNCCPTGGNKIVRYQLKAGEASWILEIDH